MVEGLSYDQLHEAHQALGEEYARQGMQVEELSRMNASLQRFQDEQNLTLLYLKVQLDELRRKLYGRTSERHAGSTDASGILSLFPEEESEAAAPLPNVT